MFSYQTISLTSHANKVTCNIFQARLQQYLNENFQTYKLDLGKAEEPEIKLPTFFESYRKQRNFKKTSNSVSLTTQGPLNVSITTSCEKFFKRWEYQTILLVSWETCIHVKKQQLEPYMEQLVQNWERNVPRLYIVTLFI